MHTQYYQMVYTPFFVLPFSLWSIPKSNAFHFAHMICDSQKLASRVGTGHGGAKEIESTIGLIVVIMQIKYIIMN